MTPSDACANLPDRGVPHRPLRGLHGKIKVRGREMQRRRVKTPRVRQSLDPNTQPEVVDFDAKTKLDPTDKP